MTGIIVIFTLLLVASALSIFVPLVRGVRDPLNFFTSGGGNRKDQDLIKKSAAASIRDLVIERESGKITEEEFTRFARPLAKQIESAEKSAAASGPLVSKSRTTKLGKFCPHCGSLEKENVCMQCGSAL